MNFKFRDIVVNGKSYYSYTVKVEKIRVCYYDDNHYRVNEIYIISARKPKFEAMFPTFPYDKIDYEVGLAKNEYQTKIRKANKKIKKLENQVVQLLSHVEAIMTVLHERLPTDDLMKL